MKTDLQLHLFTFFKSLCSQSIDLLDLQPGTYLVVVHSESFSETVRVMKM